MEAGSTLLSEFTVERPLGSGGFADVVLVRSRRTGEHYAVKRLRSADPAHQGRLLAEVQRWIDLPAHPHIAPCRFVRSVGDEVAVFTAYAPGGSLADQTRSGALYEGGERAALRRVLTAAVQAAWGLAAAHVGGLLHLDVKPANLLVGEDGAVKLTDFGLAAAPGWTDEQRMQLQAVVEYVTGVPGVSEEQRELMRAIFRNELHRAGPRSSAEVLQVSGAATGTAGYASPEQAEERQLGIPADVWSWAVTVLELLVGERTWLSGTVAALVLQAARAQPLTSNSLRVPPALADLLERCLHTEPGERPHSLGEIAGAVLRIAEQETGAPLQVTTPSALSAAVGQPPWYERRAPGAGPWSDPRKLLGYAYRTAGIDERDAVRFWPLDSGGPRAQLLADLRALREAQRVLDRPVGQEHNGPETVYARGRCAGETARVLEALGDLDGAMAHYRTAVDHLDQLADDHGDLLSVVLGSLCRLQRRAGDFAAALETVERAVDLARSLPGRPHDRNILAHSLLLEANVLRDRAAQESDEALRARAIELYEASAEEFAASDDPLDVVPTLANLASVEEADGNRQRAVELWREVDTLLDRRLTQAPADRYVRELRAKVSLQRASAAPGHAALAVEMLAPLVCDEGVYQLAGRLGEALLLRGLDEEDAGQVSAACESYAEAVVHLEQAVLRAGDADDTDRLARAYDHVATLVGILEDPMRGLEQARRSVDLWRRLSELDGLAAWGGRLIDALSKVARIALDADIPDEAERHLEEALGVLAAPEYADNAPVPDPHAALLHRDQAVWFRRTDRPQKAVQACGRALDILGSPTEETGHPPPAIRQGTAAARAYGLTLETLSAAYGDLGAYEQAVHAQEAAHTAATQWSGGGTAPSASTAESAQRLANSRLQFGLYAEAAEAARDSIDQYAALLAQGRRDLAAEASRVTGTLATALICQGDLEGAERALEQMLTKFSRLSANDPALGRAARFATRWMDSDANTPTHRRGGAVRDFIFEALTNLRRELRSLLAATTVDVPTHLATFERDIRSVSAIGAQGERREASLLLEQLVGKLTWFTVRHPSAEADQLRGEAALVLGTFAMMCGRDATAAHGFAQGIAAYRTLVTAYQRRDCADRYLRALCTPVMLHGIRGETSSVEAALGELERQARHYDRRHAAQWVQHARASIADLAPPG